MTFLCRGGGGGINPFMGFSKGKGAGARRRADKDDLIGGKFAEQRNFYKHILPKASSVIS